LLSDQTLIPDCNSYGLFKAKDKKLLERDDLSLRLDTAEKINKEYVCVSEWRFTYDNVLIMLAQTEVEGVCQMGQRCSRHR
jgi:hypothetical protein